MKLQQNKDIEIGRFSDVQYECLSSLIYFQEVPIAQVNKDKGKDKMEIELFNDFGDEEFLVKIPLDDFLEAVRLAKETLL